MAATTVFRKVKKTAPKTLGTEGHKIFYRNAFSIEITCLGILRCYPFPFGVRALTSMTFCESLCKRLISRQIHRIDI